MYYRCTAGLGRRSLLPSIPEALLSAADSADAAAKRAALLSATAPEVLPQYLHMQTTFSGGSLDTCSKMHLSICRSGRVQRRTPSNPAC